MLQKPGTPSSMPTKTTIFNWIKQIIPTTNIQSTKVQQLGDGVIYCKIINHYFPNSININRLNLNPKNQYQYTLNLKLFQNALTQHKVIVPFDVGKISKQKFLENWGLINCLYRHLASSGEDGTTGDDSKSVTYGGSKYTPKRSFESAFSNQLQYKLPEINQFSHSHSNLNNKNSSFNSSQHNHTNSNTHPNINSHNAYNPLPSSSLTHSNPTQFCNSNNNSLHLYQNSNNSGYGIYSSNNGNSLQGQGNNANGGNGTYGSGGQYGNVSMNFNRQQINTNYGYGNNMAMNNVYNSNSLNSANRPSIFTSNSTHLNKQFNYLSSNTQIPSQTSKIHSSLNYDTQASLSNKCWSVGKLPIRQPSANIYNIPQQNSGKYSVNSHIFNSNYNAVIDRVKEILIKNTHDIEKIRQVKILLNIPLNEDIVKIEQEQNIMTVVNVNIATATKEDSKNGSNNKATLKDKSQSMRKQLQSLKPSTISIPTLQTIEPNSSKQTIQNPSSKQNIEPSSESLAADASSKSAIKQGSSSLSNNSNKDSKSLSNCGSNHDNNVRYVENTGVRHETIMSHKKETQKINNQHQQHSGKKIKNNFFGEGVVFRK